MQTLLTTPRCPSLARGLRFRGTQALLCVLLLSSSFIAPAVVVQPPPPKLFRVAGRVVSPWTDGAHQPVPAKLALANLSDPDLLAPLHIVTAGEDGIFSFPHVPRGRYWLRVSLPGFSTFTAQIRVVRYSLRPRETLVVTIYTPTVGVDPSSISTERRASPDAH